MQLRRSVKIALGAAPVLLALAAAAAFFYRRARLREQQDDEALAEPPPPPYPPPRCPSFTFPAPPELPLSDAFQTECGEMLLQRGCDGGDEPACASRDSTPAAALLGLLIAAAARLRRRSLPKGPRTQGRDRG
jgi:hypothetical protein